MIERQINDRMTGEKEERKNRKKGRKGRKKGRKEGRKIAYDFKQMLMIRIKV
jgi:hypothetical protein